MVLILIFIKSHNNKTIPHKPTFTRVEADACAVNCAGSLPNTSQGKDVVWLSMPKPTTKLSYITQTLYIFNCQLTTLANTIKQT